MNNIKLSLLSSALSTPLFQSLSDLQSKVMVIAGIVLLALSAAYLLSKQFCFKATTTPTSQTENPVKSQILQNGDETPVAEPERRYRCKSGTKKETKPDVKILQLETQFAQKKLKIIQEKDAEIDKQRQRYDEVMNKWANTTQQLQKAEFKILELEQQLKHTVDMMRLKLDGAEFDKFMLQFENQKLGLELEHTKKVNVKA